MTRRTTLFVAAALMAAGTAVWFMTGRRAGVPIDSSSPAYTEVVRAFYRGLAALEVGLIDDARREFSRAGEIVPGEAAAWTNLAVTHLRVSEFDEAVALLARAATLAPDNADVAMIRGLADSARGEITDAISHFRRAVDIDRTSIRARFALSTALERSGQSGADDEAQELLDDVMRLRPDNLAALLERSRMAAKRGDTVRLRDSAAQLRARSAAWPAAALEQLGPLEAAVAAGDVAQSARALAFLRNVMARVPAFREGLAVISTPAELIAEPLDRFVTLPSPSASPDPPDLELTYTGEPIMSSTLHTGAFLLPGDDVPAVFALDGRVAVRVGREDVALSYPGPAVGLALDWNHDFRVDVALAGASGVRLFVQNADATFTDVTDGAADDRTAAGSRLSGVWAADVEMDGDLDMVLGVEAGPPLVLRNNGDGSWRTQRPWPDVDGMRGFAWGDLDRDGDPDVALLDSAGAVQVFVNQQAGQFERRTGTFPSAVVALTLADTDGDGAIELLTMTASGRVQSTSLSGGGDQGREREVGTWPRGTMSGVGPGDYRLVTADLDNNGALDVIASGRGASAIWLSAEGGRFLPLVARPLGEIVGVADFTGDGRLDLVTIAEGVLQRAVARGTRDYHWQVIRPRAQQIPGDQRINSYGVGGEVEVRSGRLVQKQLLDGAAVHLGLGTRTSIDVVRIAWPNGVRQAEFDLVPDSAIVAEQRLKGSCPWVFTYDGTGMAFVTDFLWRSPLGLRINAQDTASADQTEDWVNIRGDQLVPRDGYYDVRVTAELWETHFFDHVALLAIDHPVGTETFVDERFARQAQVRVVRALQPLQPVRHVMDDAGSDVTALVAARDGRHVAGFEKGRYQGVAREHALTFEIGPDVPQGRVWLVAQGWVHPTDSSINVAIGQGTHEPPRGLSLERQEPDGRWSVVEPDLGFPAGKNKTMLIDVSAALHRSSPTRLRLRTNLEVYWDRLGYAAGADTTPVRVTRIDAESVDLRYRGFSRTSEDRRAFAPEVPHYERLANTAPRWRDLEGYHTRFGDVRELLAGVDDRYAILNAGDELRFRFRAPAAPEAGWRRDFVLVGDGWEKDGDFNTSHSRTVHPLPRHGVGRYESSAATPRLEDDPVFQQHRDDWDRFHTRFVAPDRFLRGVRLP